MRVEYPKRKDIRLEKYDYSTPGVYFLTICTENRQPMLSSIVGGDAYIAPTVTLTPCGETVARRIEAMPLAYQNVKVHKYVIMPNHVHLLIELVDGAMWASPPTPNLGIVQSIPSLVRSLKTMTVKEWGMPIWQRNYYDRIIRSETEYLDTWRYIDQNPLQWAEDEYHPGSV